MIQLALMMLTGLKGMKLKFTLKNEDRICIAVLVIMSSYMSGWPI